MKVFKKILLMTLAFSALFAAAALGAEVENKFVPSYLDGSVTYAEGEALADALGLIYSEKDGGALFTENKADPMALSLSSRDEANATVMSFVGEIGELKLQTTYTEALTSPVKENEGKVYVPFRYVAEFFGARVYYENGTPSAERGKYYSPTLIRTNGETREVIAMPEGFESAVIADDTLLYIVGDSLYKKSLSSEGEGEYLFKAGRAHVSGNKLFVLSGGEVSSVDIESKKSVLLCKNVTMVGYTYDDYAWCDTLEKSFVYDKYGNKIAEVTGDFHNAFDYVDGLVYYTDKTARLYRAKPDGTGAELLAKAAFYPAYIDGFVYYVDMAGNYRRVNADGTNDIMVYGLNLEKIAEKEGKFIYNYFSESGRNRMLISDPDGTNMTLYSSENVAAAATPVAYRDGFAIISYFDSKPYYVTDDKAVLLEDDEPDLMVGTYGDFVYYVVR